MLASLSGLCESLVGQQQPRVEAVERVVSTGQLVEVDEDDELRGLPEEDQAAAQMRDLVGLRESGLGEEVAEALLGLVMAIVRSHGRRLAADGLREARAA